MERIKIINPEIFYFHAELKVVAMLIEKISDKDEKAGQFLLTKLADALRTENE